MNATDRDYTLEYLLEFDGHRHWLEQGHFLKFEVARVEPTDLRPHGFKYSLSLHGPDGDRLMGFDNAHTVASVGSAFKDRRAEADHWHRMENDPGRPYDFTDAEQLLADFFAEVRRILGEREISGTVIATDEKGDAP